MSTTPNPTPEPAPTKARATKAELRARVEDVLYARLNGAEFFDLRAFAKEKGWKVSDRQLWRYVEAADRLIEESLEKDREKVLRRHIAQRRALFARAINDGDVRTALAVAKDEAELEALYPAKRAEPAGKDGAQALEAMTDDERAAAIRSILSRYGITFGGGTGGTGETPEGCPGGDPTDCSGPPRGG